tara:strand:- start:27 stop:338 length:312 start_codon:yes stop_codon:yes gene_type:complete
MTATITIMYPVSGGIAITTPDSLFDWDYYKTKHMPLVSKIFKGKIKKYNLIVPKGNISNDFHAIATLFFDDINDYDGADLYKCRNDIQNFTNSNFQIILGESI